MPRASRRSGVSGRLVIDACVARASGGKDAVHPTSKRCRDFLAEVLTVCHHAVMTPQITEEWKEHQSAYARKWCVSMYARKKIDRMADTTDDMLRDRVEKAIRSPKPREAALDDIHLVEAALVAGRVVVSLDEEVRQIFSSACDEVVTLREIRWVNPDHDEVSPVQWLRGGAALEECRRLGSD